MMKKRILISAVLLFSWSFLFSQEVKQIGYEQNVLYHNEYTLGFTGHSGGFSLDFRRGKAITAFRKFLYEIELGNMRHPKEKKVYNPSDNNPRGYYFGKLNSLIILRGGAGLQKIIYGKADGKGVELRYVLAGGISFGLNKPVYLEIEYLKESSNGQIISDYKKEKFDPEKHNTGNIFGRAGFFKGIEETKIYPGVYGKLGLSVEYGNGEDVVRAIEAGVCVDAYPKVVPIMAFAKNKQTFVSLYVQLIIGRKWY